jgi:UDP-glucuronate 4-epimerase
MAYSYSHLYGIPTTGLRFFTVYGPYGRPDMAYFSFTKAITEETPIKIYNNGNMYRDFTYIDDIINGIEIILNNPPEPDDNKVKYKLYNLGNNHPVKLLDFIITLEKHIGKQAKKEYLPIQPGDVYQTFADITDMKEDFNFNPQTSIDVGLHNFVRWYENTYNI